MPGIWIDETIMNLKRTPAETLLLARICYRAGIAKDGICRDSNTELSTAVGIHAQSVSDLVKKFVQDHLVDSIVSKEKKNEREITPISQILIPYKENADRYKEKTDSDYKEIPYSAPETEPGLSGNSLDPISQILIAYKEIPYSLYKDRKPLENPLKNFLNSLTLANAIYSDDQKKEEVEPPPSDAPPNPTRADPFLRKSNAELVNIPFSQWWPLYQKGVNESRCRLLWTELTDEERQKAMANTPLYVASTPAKQYRKNPETYLESKVFNDEIIERHQNTKVKSVSSTPPATGQRFGSWGGNKFRKPADN